MKKLLLMALLGLSSLGAANAQTFVDTTAQKRNVLLEEYTGIHCGYCPDGHKTGTALSVNNPGRVFLVNIHTGGYAVPQSGEVDLRTTLGDDLLTQSGVSGYPSAVINRGSASSDRTAWTSTTNTQLGQDAPVNVAVKSSFDFASRVLTTEVEYFYTADGPATTNYLTVVLTQDSILGTQSDYGNYNPTNWTSDGYYIHNHVLRMLISAETLGEAITPTTKGSFGYKKYTTTVPETIGNIDIAFNQLKVVAFITKTAKTVVNANGCDVEYSSDIVTDLSIKDNTEYPNSFCFSSINPKATVTNTSSKTITDFVVKATINGAETEKSFTGTLAPAASTVIDWGNVDFTPKGAFTMSLSGFSKINNGTLGDANPNNNRTSAYGVAFKSKAFSQNTFKFNSSTLPNNIVLDQSENTGFEVAVSSDPQIGYNSNGAVLFYLHSSWGLENKAARIYFGEADLTQLTTPALTYYYAYSDGSQGGSAPKVKVEVSTDCGANWETANTTTLVETGQPESSDKLYIPTTEEYKLVTVDLSKYASNGVLFKYSVIPGSSGNALFIDDIGIQNGTGINDEENTTVSIYPNPTADFLRINGTSLTNEYSVVNMLGEVVLNGTYNESINVSGLSAGCYYLKMDGKSFNFIKK